MRIVVEFIVTCMFWTAVFIFGTIAFISIGVCGGYIYIRHLIGHRRIAKSTMGGQER